MVSWGIVRSCLEPRRNHPLIPALAHWCQHKHRDTVLTRWPTSLRDEQRGWAFCSLVWSITQKVSPSHTGSHQTGHERANQLRVFWRLSPLQITQPLPAPWGSLLPPSTLYPSSFPPLLLSPEMPQPWLDNRHLLSWYWGPKSLPCPLGFALLFYLLTQPLCPSVMGFPFSFLSYMWVSWQHKARDDLFTHVPNREGKSIWNRQRGRKEDRSQSNRRWKGLEELTWLCPWGRLCPTRCHGHALHHLYTSS